MGDFAPGALIPIYNPLTQVQKRRDGNLHSDQVFPETIRSRKSSFSPAAVQALGVFQASGALAPNNGGAPGTAAYVANNYLITNRGREGHAGEQVQYQRRPFIFGSKLTVFPVSYGCDRELIRLPVPTVPRLSRGMYSTNYNDLTQYSDVFRMSWDWTLAPNKLNHFYAGGNKCRQDHKPPQEYIGIWKSKFCLGNVPNCCEKLVNSTFSGGTGDTYSTWGGQADNGSENTTYAYNDDFTWTKGHHTFKFGGMLQINHYNGLGRQCEAGCVGFSYQETGAPQGSNPNRRWQRLRVFPAGTGGQRADRYRALHRPTVHLCCRICPGRLAQHGEAGSEPRAPL